MSVCVTLRPFPMICMLLRGCVLRSKQVTYSRLIRLILNLLRLPIPPHRQGTALPRYNYTTLPKVFRVRQSQSLRGNRLSALLRTRIPVTTLSNFPIPPSGVVSINMTGGVPAPMGPKLSEPPILSLLILAGMMISVRYTQARRWDEIGIESVVPQTPIEHLNTLTRMPCECR